MDAGHQWLKEAQGLRLLRAFLRLPPEKRAEVIAFAENLAGGQTPPRQDAGTRAGKG
jgi:hypothetical protein